MADIKLNTSTSIPTGASATVWVYEDTDNDGTAENIAEQVIGNGSNEYTLSGFQDSAGNDWWFYISIESGDVEDQIRIASVELNPSVEVPTAPTGLAATTASSTSIDLSWTDNSSGAGQEDEFRIERRQPGQTSFSQIDTVGTDVTTYTDTGLQQGHEYEYRVRACNTTGCSSYSNTDTAITTLPAPSSLAADAASHTSIDLTWTDNATDETGYDVDYKESSSGSWTNGPNLGANTTSTTVGGLQSGTSYDFRVRALGEDTDSSFSNIATESTFTYVNLVGEGDGSGTGDGGMSARFHLEGDGNGDGSGAATITRQRQLTASGNGDGAGNATVVRTRSITADGDGSGTGSALMTPIRNLIASGTGKGTGNAVLNATKRIIMGIKDGIKNKLRIGTGNA